VTTARNPPANLSNQPRRKIPAGFYFEMQGENTRQMNTGQHQRHPHFGPKYVILSKRMKLQKEIGA
jgi:hypothetical protein